MNGRTLAILLTSMMMLSMLAGCLGDEPQPIDDGGIEPPEILGCTHPGALNYNSDATEDDGSCEFEQEEAPVEGCTDSEATNFDPEADLDDGSCTYEEPPTLGCTDPEATNFDEEANMDDGSCEYEQAEPTPTLYEQALADAVGEQRLLVILVHYPGQPTTETVAETYDAMSKLSDWYFEASFGKTWFNTTVAGPYEFEEIQGHNKPYYFQAAIADGHVMSDFNRFIVGGHSATSGSSWSTLGYASLNVSGTNDEPIEIIGSRLVSNSPFLRPDGKVQSGLVHEMGHSFGVSHAAFAKSDVDEIREYGNTQSTMGHTVYHPAHTHFSASDKHLLGWLDNENVHTVTSSGVWTISDITQVGAGGISIAVPGDDSGERFYWLTARVDGDTTSAELVVTTPMDNQPGSGGGAGTIALDTSPETQTSLAGYDSNLHTGRSWSDPSGTVHITAIASNETSITIEVNLDSDAGPDPINSPPSIDSASATPTPAGHFEYQLLVNASDADGDELSIYWYFDLGFGELHMVGSSAAEFNLTRTFTDDSAKRLMFIVSDRRGGETVGWIDLNGYQNEPPVLSKFSFQDGWGITFGSNASDDQPLTFSWDYGDGTTGQARNGYHRYDVEGDYLISLTVSDGEFSTTLTELINSSFPGLGSNEAPIADAGQNQTVNAGSSFQLDGSGSSDSDGPQPLRYFWSCDGCHATFDSDQAVSPTVSGLGVGTWEFTLQVYDGREYATDSVWITVV